MQIYEKKWKNNILNALKEIIRQKKIGQHSLTQGNIVMEIPPQAEMGDIAFPMHPYARILKESPQIIAKKVKDILSSKDEVISVQGPYLNIILDRNKIIKQVVKKVEKEKDQFGRNNSLAEQRIMLEFSCPNTNKPLHLGHLRNNAIGESLSRILKANGAKVLKVHLYNDRGIHIIKSMLAYQKFGQGRTPLQVGVKSDHFVGDFYVKYNEWSNKEPEIEKQAQNMLKQWEDGNEDVLALWNKMNKWAIDGINQTYNNTGIKFDRSNFESQTYKKGKQEVLNGLYKGIFFKKDDGSIWIDLKNYNLDQKVLLRGDGTSLYLTQDIGTAVERYNDWPFNRMIFVVGSEQIYHFKVLFKILELLGYKWAKNMHHLAYGMVNLTHGKMKSREGIVIDADDLIKELTDLAQNEIMQRNKEAGNQDIKKVAKSIALGALFYYLLKITPNKDMIFNPVESIAFQGDTGPYLQYTGARITSILKKYQTRKEKYKNVHFNSEILNVQEEWDLIKQIAFFPKIVKQAAEELNPSLITSHLYELAKLFHRYYHDNPVLHNEDPVLVVCRIHLVKTILQIIKNGFNLLAIPFLEKM